MRYIITMTVFGISTMLTACGSLNHHDGIDNVFTYETNIDDGQQLIVDDIEATFADASDELLEPENNATEGGLVDRMAMRQDQGRHDRRRQHGVFHRGFAVDWMIDYIEGISDASGVFASIEEKHTQLSSRIERREIRLLDLLESFDEDQAEQFLSNLDERQAQIEERLEERGSRSEPGDMFEALNLSEEQQSEVEALLANMREDRLIAPEGLRELIEEFLTAEKTREEVEAAFEIIRSERHQHHLEMASDWIDFVDGLNAEQQATLLSVLEEIQERLEERRSETEENRGVFSESQEEDGSVNRSEQGGGVQYR